MAVFKEIPEYSNLSVQQFFEEVVPKQKPVVIRGFGQQWPLVAAAKRTPNDFVAYLARFYNGKKARISVAPPAAKKRFFYTEDMAGVTYTNNVERVDVFLAQLIELIDKEVYPALSMQGSLPREILPGLIEENKTEFFSDAEPRLWVGNEGIIDTHFDGTDNFACVVAGHRRFVLFPPEQTGNLYPGSLDVTPAGVPVSLVNLCDPDYDRYPHFSTALANAYSVVLGPGDAIFIPMLWWHHVESLAKVNALMNYWWNGSFGKNSSRPNFIDSLKFAVLAMRDLTPKQRDAWRHMFDHYLFKQGIDPASYIPEHQQHVLGKLSPEYIRGIKDYFIEKLKK